MNDHDTFEIWRDAIWMEQKKRAEWLADERLNLQDEVERLKAKVEERDRQIEYLRGSNRSLEKKIDFLQDAEDYLVMDYAGRIPLRETTIRLDKAISGLEETAYRPFDQGIAAGLEMAKQIVVKIQESYAADRATALEALKDNWISEPWYANWEKGDRV